MHYKIIFFLLVFALAGCNESYNQADCEILSMEKYKGIPKSSHLFDKHCANRDIKFTREICQKALQKLIMGTTKKALNKEFGPEVINCFTGNDLQKFPLSDSN